MIRAREWGVAGNRRLSIVNRPFGSGRSGHARRHPSTWLSGEDEVAAGKGHCGSERESPSRGERRRRLRDASFVACRLRPPALGSGGQTGQDEVEAQLELNVVIAGDDVWRNLAHAWEALGIDRAHI